MRLQGPAGWPLRALPPLLRGLLLTPRCSYSVTSGPGEGGRGLSPPRHVGLLRATARPGLLSRQPLRTHGAGGSVWLQPSSLLLLAFPLVPLSALPPLHPPAPRPPFLDCSFQEHRANCLPTVK